MSGARSRRVLVLLPVWNGGQWLRGQLDSILGQQDVQVTILCRDDGSTDDSPDILQRYREQFPEQIHTIQDDEGNLGACGSFSRLMQHALEHDLERDPGVAIALADQDDIWHPERLSVTLAALDEAEEGGCPVLVHSDLRVVDERLEPVAPSLIRYQGLQPWRTSLASQLLSNPVTGCTTLMNRALLQYALPIPERAIMHDWWLTLIATLYGKRIYIDRALVDYRQHGSNAVGAKAWQAPQRWGTLLQRAFDRGNQSAFEMVAAQAQVFLEQHGRNLTAGQRRALRMILWQPRLPAPLQKILFRLLRRL